MSQTEATHPSLLMRLRNGADEAGWRDFHARYGHLLYRFARSRGAGHADAEDVAQEVLLQFLRCAERFTYDAGKGRFRGYLRAAVIHEMARRARRSARQPVGMDPRTFDFLAAEHEAERDERWRLEWKLCGLRWAVDEIAGEFDATTLKAFEMHVLANCSAVRTAEKLGISRWRVYRARQRVLRRLSAVLNRSELEPGA